MMVEMAAPAAQSYRLAFCIESMSPSGGSELNAVRTAELLAARGHHLTVMTMTPRVDGMYPRYAAAGISVHNFSARSLISRDAWHRVREATAFMQAQQVDVVHSHDPYSNFLMTLAARRAGVPAIASKRWSQYGFPQHRLTDIVAFRAAERVLANSDTVADSARRQAWLSPARVAVVSNFADDRVFKTPLDRAATRARFGYGESDCVVVIVARLRSEKNHRGAIDACQRAATVNPALRLLLVGDGPEQQSLESLVRDRGLTDRIQFVGHLDEAWRAFGAADLAMLPSLHEGFPNAVVEAMAVGIPVLASDVGGIPDAVVDKDTGLLVPPLDVNAWVRALEFASANPEWRRRAGRAGRLRAEAHFSASAAVAKLEALYAELVRART